MTKVFLIRRIDDPTLRLHLIGHIATWARFGIPTLYATRAEAEAVRIRFAGDTLLESEVATGYLGDYADAPPAAQ